MESSSEREQSGAFSCSESSILSITAMKIRPAVELLGGYLSALVGKLRQSSANAVRK